MLLWSIIMGLELACTSKVYKPHYFIKLCTFKPIGLIEKEKRESLTTLQVCHSKHCEESLKESLVAKSNSSGLQALRHDNSSRVSSNSNRDSSLDSQAQNDNGIKSTRNPKSNDSQKAHSNSSPLAGVQNDKIISLAGRPSLSF
ncbi:hypothetical protein CQA63_01415 [Helicobacter marmotae]|uniref:Uncharacterized protein n=1 Tax=Helicobacter marmotae TaxID=152490 RepID=A0A3D8I6N5_9HELI|nr:hypothetical protein CQA63_01415 [Helicobacter marmotae]